MCRDFTALPTTWATMPFADFCCTFKKNRSLSSRESTTCSRSPVVSSIAFSAPPPDLPALAFDGYGLCCSLPTRPRVLASYPVLVHRRTPLLHASFRPHLAMTPLRFANPSPPSGWNGDLHPTSYRTCTRPPRTRSPSPANLGCDARPTWTSNGLIGKCCSRCW